MDKIEQLAQVDLYFNTIRSCCTEKEFLEYTKTLQDKSFEEIYTEVQGLFDDIVFFSGKIGDKLKPELKFPQLFFVDEDKFQIIKDNTYTDIDGKFIKSDDELDKAGRIIDK